MKNNSVITVPEGKIREVYLRWFETAPLEAVMDRIPLDEVLWGHSNGNVAAAPRVNKPVLLPFGITPSRTVPKVVRHHVTPQLGELIRKELKSLQPKTREFKTQRDDLCRRLRLTRKQIVGTLSSGNRKKRVAETSVDHNKESS